MKSLYEISKKLENKEVSSLELTQESISMSEKNEHNAYISVLAQRALKQAKASDERISSGKRCFRHLVFICACSILYIDG